jgi:hypothetical protein
VLQLSRTTPNVQQDSKVNKDSSKRKISRGLQQLRQPPIDHNCRRGDAKYSQITVCQMDLVRRTGWEGEEVKDKKA